MNKYLASVKNNLYISKGVIYLINKTTSDIVFNNPIHNNNLPSLSSLYSDAYSENIVDNFIFNSNINDPKVIK